MEEHNMDGAQHDEEEWAGEFNPLADPEERRVLYATIDSFKQYRRTAHLTTTHRRRQNFYALPRTHQELLSSPSLRIQATLNAVDDAIDVNADIADAILETGLAAFGLPANPDEIDDAQGRALFDWRGIATPSDLHKAHQTIRQFYRDWSAEGIIERDACYGPVLADLERLFPWHDASSSLQQARADLSILIPGAGLGRLVFEVCRAGFAAEGNEISYHQLLASSWILNHTAYAKQHTLYPFIRDFSNLQSRKDQLAQVLIPDVHPGAALSEQPPPNRPPPGSMAMSAADFTTLYTSPKNAASYDAVVTVFFIDTAPNLLRYIETIKHCLKPGGYWLNLGPLLWHFDDRAAKKSGNDNDSIDEAAGHVSSEGALGIGEPGSVELTNEEVLDIVGRMGFEIQTSQIRERECGYIQAPGAMLQHMYRVSHWIAKRI